MKRTFSLLLLIPSLANLAYAAVRPNVVLVMADDQGWGQTGYYGHPALKTPNLDAMAANGLRFDRFYAGGPVCSPTRASVLTGRTHDRTGVLSHGYALRLQEKTLPAAMKAAGYATGHFGKWHLNGLRGPGVPVLDGDSHSPGAFGFDTWLSVTNFFDKDPLMGRNGKIEEFVGDSSEIIVSEALSYIRENVVLGRPFFTVIWYGSPHSPFLALEGDKRKFPSLDEKSSEHYGELAAMDRSIGTLREGLKDAGVAEDTLIWFCSDNGGLPGLTPPSTGGLRGFKGSMFEGGLRVPGIIEWPRGIIKPRITKYPAGVVDIFPTISELCGLPSGAMLEPQDGSSLAPLFLSEIGSRKKPLIFRSNGRHSIVDNDWKIISEKGKKIERLYSVYKLDKDIAESRNLFDHGNEVSRRLVSLLEMAAKSIAESEEGKDYPEGVVKQPQPTRKFWRDDSRYQPYFERWSSRPEYMRWINKN